MIEATILNMMELNILKYTPSHLAATAVLAALRILSDLIGWTPRLERHTGFFEAELRTCVQDVCGLLKNAHVKEAVPTNLHTSKAVYRKYSKNKFHQAALLPFV
ncbi:Cyclin, C-terminal domain-containing protein [Baffinella frigidus]|nr:Cyclin, C-terminal domain-containing protein [Cryptophyta sp. CCMP2293]